MYLPPHVLQALYSVSQPDGPVVQVIENMPTDPLLPAPPTDGQRPASKTRYVSESALIGSTIAAGFDVMTFAQEKNGAIPQEVAPVIGLENSNSSASREDFGAHADNPILDEKVRVLIALIGLVNERETETYFASLEDTLSALPSKTVDLLFQRLYKVRYPESFRMGNDFTKTQPVLFKGPDGAIEVKFAAWNNAGINQDAEDALTALRNVLPKLLRPIVLKKGTFVLFSNTRCFHSRGRIEGQRWAQRIYCCKPDTLATLQQATGVGLGSRVFDARQLVNL
jgi:L-asparagine oxygenase